MVLETEQCKMKSNPMLEQTSSKKARYYVVQNVTTLLFLVNLLACSYSHAIKDNNVHVPQLRSLHIMSSCVA